MTKNEQISSSLKTTREERINKDCVVFELKADKSHISESTAQQIKRVFLEAKWLYNYVLSQDDVFDVSDKLSEVSIKVRDVFEKREINTLGSQMKQSVIDGLQQNILNLSKKKKKGAKVGALKFISHYDSIDLKQFGNTFRIKGNRIKVQGIAQYIRVRGLEQLKDCDIANAKFIQKAGDYYFHITCYRQKKENIMKQKPVVGIDFGLSHQLTLSDGEKGFFLDYQLPFPKRLRKLYRRWSKKTKRSANWYKDIVKINNEFEYWNNCKKDAQNKIFHILTDEFRVCYQNDNIRGWQRIWGRKVLSTRIGGLTAKFRKSPTSVQVDRFFASTKTCSHCNHKQDIELDERIFKCEKCGYIAPRDFNSGTNMLQEGNKKIGAECAKSTPTEMSASTLALVQERLNAVPRVLARLVVEVGNLAYS